MSNSQDYVRSPGTTYHEPLTRSIPRLKSLNIVSRCSSCGVSFNLFRLKHNCYNCGNVVCGRCSDNKTDLPKFGYFEPMRVCNLCYSYLKITRMNRLQIGRLSTKKLREYISAYNLPCRNIIEKDDLINVILAHIPLEECYEIYYRDHYPVYRETASDIRRNANYARAETQNNTSYSQSRYQNTVPQPQPQPRSQPQFQPQSRFQPQPQPPQQNYQPPQNSSYTAPISLQTIIRDKLDISKFSVKTIKEILKENCVDYSKMVEKSELIERMEILIKWAKHEMSNNNTGEISDDGLCRICCDAQSNCLFMDCGHMCTCLECGKKLQVAKNECPICRDTIIKIIRVFKA